MAVLFLCFQNDPVATGILGRLTGIASISGEYSCSFSAESQVFPIYGTVKYGSIGTGYAQGGKSVSLAFLNRLVDLAAAVKKCGARPDQAILVATAHPSQIEAMERLDKDMFPGYVIFNREKAPYVDIGNAVLLTKRHSGRKFIDEMALLLVERFVFPEVEEGGKQAQTSGSEVFFPEMTSEPAVPDCG